MYGVYVYKILSRIFKKWLRCDILAAKNDHFRAISRDFCIFPIFKCCPIWTIHEVILRVIFSIIDENSAKNMRHVTQNHNF